LTQKILKI